MPQHFAQPNSGDFNAHRIFEGTRRRASDTAHQDRLLAKCIAFRKQSNRLICLRIENINRATLNHEKLSSGVPLTKDEGIFRKSGGGEIGCTHKGL